MTKATTMHEARLEVDAEGDAFRIRLIDVTGAGAELASGLTPGDAFTDGFDDAQLTYQGNPVTGPGLVQLYASPTDNLDGRRTFGRYLYRLLTPGHVGVCWDDLRREHQGSQGRLSTLLEIRPSAWQQLPWELTYHPHEQHLFMQPQHSLGLRRPQGRVTPSRCRWPLRMLVIVGCDSNDDQIRWEPEVLAVQRAMCQFSLRVDLRIVRAPLTPNQAGEEIASFRPHIFHFIGHGTSDDGGSLQLAQDVGGGGSLAWRMESIATAFRHHPQETPRLAVFNACETAGAAGTPGDSAVAEALAGIGCPAVIAMRGKIDGEAASVFAESFYDGLAGLGLRHVDQAYCRALERTFNHDTSTRDWSLPRIFFQTSASGVFPIPGECRGFDKVTKGFDDLKQIRPFVNCDQQRFELYHALDCWLEDPEPEFQVLLVRGKEGTGKTWLLKALVYVASLRGFRTSYFSFTDENDDEVRYSLEEFLQILRHGSGDDYRFFTRPLADDDPGQNPFADFDAPPAAPALAGDEDRRTPRAVSFAQGLKAAAETQPYLLALDHIGSFLDWRYIRDPLIRAATRGSLEGGLGTGVRIIIAASDEEFARCNEQPTYDLKSLRMKSIETAALPAELFEEHFLQYQLFHLKDEDRAPQILTECADRARTLAATRATRAWPIRDLDTLYRILYGA